MSNGIIIPCYNESSRLELQSFIDYAANNKDNVLCFVNDGSSDATRQTLAEIKTLEHENVHIYNLAENAGKAKAVQQGALYLYENTEVDTIGFIDADLSTDFNDYSGLLQTMDSRKGTQVVYGSRAGNGENNIKRDGVRSIISKIVRIIIFCITRLKIEDTQCGAKVFDRTLIPILFTEEFKTRWLFDVEILLRLKKYFGLKAFRKLFIEQPLTRWVHMEGSKLGMKDAISIPMSLLSIGWIYNVYQPLMGNVIVPVRSVLNKVFGHGIMQLATVALIVTTAVVSFFTQTFPGNVLLVLSTIALTACINSIKTRMKPKLTNSLRWLWIKAYIKKYFRATH